MSASNHLPSERDSELLSAYLDGALSPRDNEALEKRLARDDTLRSQLDALRSTAQMLRMLPPLRAPRDFTLDPALYQRKSAWWQRLFESGLVLQVSGAVGTVAAIALIVLAMTLNTHRQAQPSAQKDTADSVALQPSPTAAPSSTTTPTGDEEAGTAIAYSGEGLFQATLAMQSTYYAPQPTAGSGVDQAQGAFRETASTGTPPPTEPIAAEAFAAAAADTSAAGAAAQDEQPMQPLANEGEANALSAAPPAALPQAAAPSPLTAAATPTSAAVGQTADNLAPGQANGGSENAPQELQEPPGVADTTLSDAGQEEAVVATPTLAATAAPSTGPAVVERDAARQSDKARTETSHPWWLAGIGAVVLAFSVSIFAVGRRKARPA